jgi:hypothetical protein
MEYQRKHKTNMKSNGQCRCAEAVRLPLPSRRRTTVEAGAWSIRGRAPVAVGDVREPGVQCSPVQPSTAHHHPLNRSAVADIGGGIGSQPHQVGGEPRRQAAELVLAVEEACRRRSAGLEGFQRRQPGTRGLALPRSATEPSQGGEALGDQRENSAGPGIPTSAASHAASRPYPSPHRTRRRARWEPLGSTAAAGCHVHRGSASHPELRSAAETGTASSTPQNREEAARADRSRSQPAECRRCPLPAVRHLLLMCGRPSGRRSVSARGRTSLPGVRCCTENKASEPWAIG